jgi:triosephosphate isomerase
MKRLIVANWKMNPQSAAEAKRLFAAVSKTARRLKNIETVICPPFPFLCTLRPARHTFLGVQDVFWEKQGAFTGEVSPKMLKNLGATWVIVGHSERRQNFGETDEMINKKVKAALAAGLKVIFCVGETLQERRRGQTKAALRRQLRKALVGMRSLVIGHWSLVIAYEPVWAIGSGLAETPQNAESAALFIRAELSKLLAGRAAKGIRIIYGGSANSKNISGYIAMPAISGALVGGASLNPKEFIRMLEISDQS